ncbi:trypsin alpha-3-like [Drosophila ficusphila]|uniref:trypsin alpha-3-like n=1 Tax=Drosophila ficusphila TaxID=30025 RepID=UPI0007E7947E|nr:trypsin alpha-3-like [Drosophila ficusphila]
MELTKIGSVLGIAIFAFLWTSATSEPQSLEWSGHYIDNSTHYILYKDQRIQSQGSLLGNISTNPAINAIENQDYFPNRIVNGKKIKCTRAPYQCSLHYDNTFLCGCVILSRHWILTAHHCKIGRAGHYTVRAGSTQQRRGGQLRQVQKTVVHPGFSTKTMKNDLCMMKLKSPLNLGTCVQKAKLPSVKTKYFPHCYLASGWGLTSSKAQNPQRYLRGVVVCMVDRSKCQQDYRQEGIKIYREMICADRQNRDTCSGDSGGPLVHKGVLYGITSFGIGCANAKYPGVYANVLQFVPWIKETARKH